MMKALEWLFDFYIWNMGSPAETKEWYSVSSKVSVIKIFDSVIN